MGFRKHPAHGVVLLADKPVIAFLTVCSKDRVPWLACEEVHQLLRATWAESTAWLVGRYVIMPDHVHLFAAPNENFIPHIDLDRWVKYWKSQFTMKHGNRRHRWQTDHWDRRIRHDESYDEKWEYVSNNPRRHGLVADADDWPYQGEIFELRWE
jgi:putative transposase